MKGRLNPEWRKILRRAWSIRFMFLAIIFIGLEAVVPYLSDSFPPKIFLVLMFLSVAGGIVSRMYLQNGFNSAD